MPENHALLGASVAKQWLNCPPSVRLTENMPEKPSKYAAEGTLAHAIGELKLRKKFEVMKKSEFDKKLKELKASPNYSPEMDGHTDTYCDYVSGLAHSYKAKPYVVIEKQVNYSHIAPEGFGTCDCLMLCGEDMHVIDFKYGQGVIVSAEDNPQLKLYALGAAAEYSLLYSIKNVTLHIVQPRTAEGNSSWSVSAEDLISWGESIKPIAALAYEGKGEFKAGGHCMFCKAKASCRAQAEYRLSEAGFTNVPPELLSNEELGRVLRQAQSFAKWLSCVEDYALNEILNGRPIEGFKAVEGRSNRVITDIDAAFEVLKTNGYDEALLYERKPITLTALEKLVTKSQLSELIGKFIEKPQGKPTLVPLDDKRPDFKPDLTKIFGGN